ncbi:MAG: tetratricopeptide repeat protein, partial [Thermoanaerobaculia bacterium]
LSVVADDGCIAYLNSVEVGRLRVDSTRRRVPFDAGGSSSPPEPVEWERIWIEPGLLQRGENVLALQGFARSRSSADVSLIPVLVGLTAREAARDDKLLSDFREGGGDPAAALLLYFEGRVLQRQGNHPAAADRFSRVLENDGASDLARCRLVECLRRCGRAGEADANLKALQESTREVPVDDPRVLSNAAWRIVRDRHEELEAFQRAYLWASKAAGLRPLDAGILNTLGLAQYRLGLHQEALATLLHSESLALIQLGGSQPADVAFLALTYERLGKTREAREALGRLRGMMAQETRRFDWEAGLFLREAEELIAP